MKKYLVLSDSHGFTSKMAGVVLKENEIDDIIFLGDGERDIAAVKNMFPKKRYFRVSGNCDFGSRLEKFLTINHGDKRIGICHGHLFRVKESLNRLISHGEKAGLDAVLFGHTHMPTSLKTPSGLILLNPGSIMNGCYAVLSCGDEIFTKFCRE